MGRARSTEVEYAELPPARPARWCVLAAAFTILTFALLVLPYVVAFPARAPAGAITLSVVFSVAVVACVVLALYGVGRARLERAALNANRLDVAEFTYTHEDIDVGETAAELTARFKRKLTESKLYTPAAVPGVAGSYDFIRIVEGAGEGTQGWWQAATRLVTLVRPPPAFRVVGTIHQGPGRTHTLVVELFRQPGFAASPVILTGDDLPDLLGRAANAIAARVMPRSKHCRSVQWAAWQDARVPDELFDAYERANQLSGQRRYDEALAEYHRALAHDPSNVYIRLEIGNLQERLEMHLDALVTYDDVVTLCSRHNPKLAAWWNTQASGDVPQGELAAALLLARYRHALVLARGDWIAHEWWEPEELEHQAWNAREARRVRLREIIRQRFTRYSGIDGIPDPGDLLKPRDRLDADNAVQLRAYLCLLAQYEMERLIHDYQPARKIRWRTARTLAELLSPGTLRLGLLSVLLRRAMAEFEMRQKLDQPLRPLNGPPGTGPLYAAASWPPDAGKLTAAVRTGMGRTSGWHEHYNAACVYAIALLPTGLRARTRTGSAGVRDPETFARLAVEELEKAAANAHSGRLGRRRPWVMVEDPDLSALRGHARWRDFEMVTFAPERPAPVRPHRVHIWELVCYCTALVAESARQHERCWRLRDAGPPAGSGQLADWQAAETAAWEAISALATSHQDWLTRYAALTALCDTARERGAPVPEVRFPPYSERELFTRYAALSGDTAAAEEWKKDPAPRRVDEATADYISRCDERMRLLAEALRDRGLPDQHGEDFAHVAHRWARLAEWFRDTPGAAPVKRRREAFTATLSGA
ncbi:hypothetical protein [Amycolatopsis suaedae]|uniref:Uncharacterized protein n=1 Tax=Amycolatopsis suaedae TaxID=2510978 RepID=A0A4Q7J495_9PSEU|nr:hypothetical protein [Amycolatopsis suaedae]RZQ60814.1 hypothetical protein EWH70_27305 [Amycolatopsis suaedae]